MLISLPVKSPSIAVVGNSCVDIFLSGSPGWPAPGQRQVILPTATETKLGGNGLNVAIGLSALGRVTTLYSAIGADPNGEHLLAEVTRSGRVSVVNMVQPEDEIATYTSRSYVIGDKNPSYLHFVGASTHLTPRSIANSIAKGGVPHYLLLVSWGLLPGLEGRESELLPWLRTLRAQGTRVVVDINLVADGDPGRWQTQLGRLLREVDIFVPNIDEARQFLGREGHASVPTEAGEMAITLLKEYGVALAIIIKCDSRGCVVATLSDAETLSKGIDGPKNRNDKPREYRWTHVEAVTGVDVKDTIGAGDAWLAGFINRLAEIDSLRPQHTTLVDACQDGNATAALCVASTGATAWTKNVKSA